MEAHLAPKQPIQVNKITSLCEICNGPHDTQYCMENFEQAFVEYESQHTNEAGDKQFTMNQGPISFNEAANAWNDSFSTYSSKQNRNPSSPKHVHLINSIVILNNEDEAMEEGSVKSSATEYKDHEITVKSEEEFKGETEEKNKEEEEDNPKHLDAFPHYKGIRVLRMALEKSSAPMGKGQD
ncbi:hypothetical protein Tco_0163803 [Tanacetum coccineum]